jgi:hypothetical protein
MAKKNLTTIDPGVPTFDQIEQNKDAPDNPEKTQDTEIIDENNDGEDANSAAFDQAFSMATVKIEFPMAETGAETGLEYKHISVQLSSDDNHLRRLIGKLYLGLKFNTNRTTNYSLRNGRPIVFKADAIRWLLEQVEAGLEGGEIADR